MDVPAYVKVGRKKNALKQIGGTRGPKAKGLKMTNQELKRRRNLQLIAKGGVFSSDSRANVLRLLQMRAFENA